MHKQLIERPIILAVVGKSAAGKDYLATYLTNKFLSLGLSSHKMVSMTTRPARVGEKEGVDYFFVDDKEFAVAKVNKELIEYTHFREWYYGVPYKEVQPGFLNVGVFNLEGLESLQKVKDNYTIIPIYIEEKITTRLQRSFKREQKWKIEYFRRAFVDWLAFRDAEKTLRKFHGRYICLKEIGDIEKQFDLVLLKLEKWEILKHNKEKDSIELYDFV